jgi:hypothetical protein
LTYHRVDRAHVGGNGVGDGVLGGVLGSGRQGEPVQLDYWCRNYTPCPRPQGRKAPAGSSKLS